VNNELAVNSQDAITENFETFNHTIDSLTEFNTLKVGFYSTMRNNSSKSYNSFFLFSIFSFSLLSLLIQENPPDKIAATGKQSVFEDMW
jgi:hypothetical protein